MISFKKKIIENYDFFFSDIYHEFQRNYHNENYKLEEVFIKEGILEYYIPYTIIKKNSFNHLSFFGNQLQIYSNNIVEFKRCVNVLKIFLKKLSINNLKYNVCFQFNQNPLTNEDLIKYNINQVYTTQEISLENKLNNIFNSFKPNLKNYIKKNIKEKKLDYKIYNYLNYPEGKISEMKKMHFFVSGKKTRSDHSWHLNEKWIKEKKGFLIEIIFNKKSISYSFFAHDLNRVVYFSSVTDRNYFKYHGINHFSLWKSIVYSKSIGLKKFELGITKYHYFRSENKISEKEKNIAFFKSRFGGKINFFLSIDEKSNI